MSSSNLDDEDISSMRDLLYCMNRSNIEKEPLPPVPYLAPLTPQELATTAEPTTAFLLNEDPLPRMPSYPNLVLPVTYEAAVAAPTMSTDEAINETSDVQPTSEFINNIVPQNEPPPNTQPHSDAMTADADRATEYGEEEQESKSVKKKKKPRYDRVFACNQAGCENVSKQLKMTGAKSHVTKHHKGMDFHDVMVLQPKKYRKSRAKEEASDT